MLKSCKTLRSAICLLLVAVLLAGGLPAGVTAAQETQNTVPQGDNFVPVLRFAVTSDVHIRNDAEKINGHEQLAKLYETVYAYAENHPVYDKLDALFFIGDNTQGGSEQQQTYFFNYLKEHTREGTYALATMGNHEFKATGQNYNDPVGATEKFLEYSGYETTDTRFELGGYQFIALAPDRYNKAQYLFFTQEKLDWLKKELDAAVAATPDKPIFVLQHQPPYGTMKGTTGTGADKGLKELLVNYPQVIDFSGHTHCSLSDPRIIWQGEFTAINTGGLAYLSVPIMNGTNDEGINGREIDEEGGWVSESEDSAVRNAGMYYIVEIDANDTVRVLTYNMFTESLYGEPFILDSIDPADFRYTDARRNDALHPEFPAGAKLQLLTNNYKNLQFTIPQATCKDVVQSYRVEVYQGATKIQTLYRLSGANYGDAAPETVNAYVKNLAPNTSYTVKVYATSSYNLDSEPLTMTVTTGGEAIQADILDVVFQNDGTAVNAVSGDPLKTYGEPNVSYDPLLRRNVAAFCGRDAYGFWGISNWYDVIATSYTLETMAYLDKVPESGSMGILANLQSASIGFTYNTDGQIQFYSRLKSGSYTILKTTAEPGSWVHLAGTYDGSTLKYYINGELAAQEEIVGTLAVPAYLARCMYLGADCNVNSRESFFTGRIASAKLYSYPLSADQVAQQYRLATAAETDCPAHGAQQWVAVGADWSDGGAISTGHYVLRENISLANPLTVAQGEQVCIDLCGFDITASGTAAEGGWYRVFENYGQLTVMDTGFDTGIISGGTVWNNTDIAMGGNVYNGENAEFSLYGGTIRGGISTVGTYQAVGSIGGNLYGAAGSQIHIYGGRVEDGAVTGASAYTSGYLGGGNIGSDGAVYIHGGTVKGGTVSNSFTNTAKTANLSLYGGNIAMREGGALHISGGMILDGLLTGTRTNNSSTCKAYGRGGNIAASSAPITITGGYISGGKIQVTSAGKATGTTVPANASAFGGNVYILNADLNISGGTIADGVLDCVAKAVSSSTSTGKARVTSNGGNIYITEGVTATITGGTITGGSAKHNTAAASTDTHGGNVFVANGGVVTVSGGKITDGYSYYRGGNIGLNDGSRLTLSGNALVSGGVVGTHSANCNGENIYVTVENTCLTVAENARVLSSGENAGIYAVTNSAVLMTGGQVKGGVLIEGSSSNPKACFAMYGGRLDSIGKNTYIADSSIQFYNGILEQTPNTWLASCACYTEKGCSVFAVWHTGANDGSCPDCGYDYTAVTLQMGAHTFVPDNGRFLCHCGAATKGVAQRNGTYYGSLETAMAEATEGEKLQLLENTRETVLVPVTVTLDLNGNMADGAVIVADGATLFVADSQTDDYTVADDFGYGRLGYIAGCVAAAEGYRMLTQAEGVSFHKVDVTLQTVSLRTSEAGIYYTGSFRYDEAVAAQVAYCGVTLSVVNAAPVADDSDKGCRYTKDHTSVLVRNILSDSNSAEKNSDNANREIFARAYICMADGSFLYSKTSTTHLQLLVETIDARVWDELNVTQKAALRKLYEAYQNVMELWNTPNLKKYA